MSTPRDLRRSGGAKSPETRGVVWEVSSRKEWAVFPRLSFQVESSPERVVLAARRAGRPRRVSAKRESSVERGKNAWFGSCALLEPRFVGPKSGLKALLGLSFLKGGIYPEGCAIASSGKPAAVYGLPRGRIFLCRGCSQVAWLNWQIGKPDYWQLRLHRNRLSMLGGSPRLLFVRCGCGCRSVLSDPGRCCSCGFRLQVGRVAACSGSSVGIMRRRLQDAVTSLGIRGALYTCRSMVCCFVQ